MGDSPMNQKLYYVASKNVTKSKKWAKLDNVSHQPTEASLGIVTGNPGVFLGNLHPYPLKPVPTATGAGFNGYGYGFYETHALWTPYWVNNPNISGVIPHSPGILMNTG